jgi:hypothetical protein
MLQLVLCVLHKVVIIFVFVKSWPWEINKVVFCLNVLLKVIEVFCVLLTIAQ